MGVNYLFKSARLGFRNWEEGDFAPFSAMNADEEVMKHFPKPLTPEETRQLMDRMDKMYQERGYTYYAVETLSDQEFVGFIGLVYQDYVSQYTPAVDIGWRLKKSAWGYGYATEGARRVLEHAAEELNLETLIATCTLTNTASENVMKKLGMKRLGVYEHPKLMDYPGDKRCVTYKIKLKDFIKRKD